MKKLLLTLLVSANIGASVVPTRATLDPKQSPTVFFSKENKEKLYRARERMRKAVEKLDNLLAKTTCPTCLVYLKAIRECVANICNCVHARYEFFRVYSDTARSNVITRTSLWNFKVTAKRNFLEINAMLNLEEKTAFDKLDYIVRNGKDVEPGIIARIQRAIKRAWRYIK